MFLGNEASADAANPTIGIGTTDGELGSVSTSLFSFKGQVPSLLEEELGLLRGRDDFLQPGVRTAPAYNRFYWNFTRGIDAGEVIYALNYNINEDQDGDFDGVINGGEVGIILDGRGREINFEINHNDRVEQILDWSLSTNEFNKDG